MSDTTTGTCPDCGTDVGLTRTGRLRRHQCSPAAQLPAGNEDQAAVVVLAGDGRPKCYVEACELPEFMDNVGLCGGHWATRIDLRKVARRHE